MDGIYLALYKGKKTGRNSTALLARFSDWLTRKLTKGIYSHCELVVAKEEPEGGHYNYRKHYYCYSSSIRDSGVRVIEYMQEDKVDNWQTFEGCKRIIINASASYSGKI